MPLLMLGSSVVAQVVVRARARATERTLDAGCVLLVLGAGLVALSVAQGSMAELVAGALVAGAGQGLTVATGLAAVNARVDPAGLGVASQVWDLRTAGVGFCAGVAVLAAPALAALQMLRRRHRG